MMSSADTRNRSRVSCARRARVVDERHGNERVRDGQDESDHSKWHAPEGRQGLRPRTQICANASGCGCVGGQESWFLLPSQV